jgi:NAD(P)-dependent dehydrogenase (short-subunit alcohol dehydrogenase family)
MEIAGKVALVTGAATGIGRATALALGSEGASLVCVDLDEQRGLETVALVEQAGTPAIFVRADVSKPDDVRAMFEAAIATFGGVDIVHNNAGLICGEPIWPETPLEKIAAVIAVNLGGVAMGTQQGIAVLRRRGGGVIVNTASVAALAPMPTDPVYSATKVAVVRIVESCAGLAAEGIRVNAILPGMVDTEMTMKHTGDGTRPAKWLEPLISPERMLQPEAIARAVLDLVRDDEAVGEARVVSAS